jgi:hypothetical protein
MIVFTNPYKKARVPINDTQAIYIYNDQYNQIPRSTLTASILALAATFALS